MILCNVTFSIYTPDSVENADTDEGGFISENTPFTFRELVEWMRGAEVSTYPARGDVREWLTKDQGETQAYFEHGIREEHSLFYSNLNPPHKDKYWGRAMRAAGIRMRAAP